MNKERENVCVAVCEGIPTDVLKRLIKYEGARRDFAQRAMQWIIHNPQIFYSDDEVPVDYSEINCEILHKSPSQF